MTWRRSARSSGEALGARDVVAASTGLTACLGTQNGNGVEQLHPVSECCYAKLLQVLFRQAWKNRLVNLILAERSLILFKARLRSQIAMSMMRPRLLLAAYHSAKGTERAYSDVGVGKRAAGAAGTQAVVGAKVSIEPSELLNSAAAEDITLIATVHDSFGCLPSRANGSAGSLRSSSSITRPAARSAPFHSSDEQFPSGFLVAVLLTASGILWAVMFFGPLAHLSRLSGGMTPFDIRPGLQLR